MKAILVNKDADSYQAEVTEVSELELPEGEVSIVVDY